MSEISLNVTRAGLQVVLTSENMVELFYEWLEACFPEIPRDRMVDDGKGTILIPLVPEQIAVAAKLLEEWATKKARKPLSMKKGKGRTVIKGLPD